MALFLSTGETVVNIPGGECFIYSELGHRLFQLFSKLFGLEGPAESRFMLMNYSVRPERRSQVPAITHADGTGRVQTVTPEGNALFHELIRQFAALTGVPVLLNTSFNVRGEPIVCTPPDAVNCFLKTGLDHLVMGDMLASKP